MAKRKVRIGLVGYQFMGKAHSNAYRQAPRFFDLDWEPELAVICGRSEGPLRAAAEKFGWAEVETDWRRLVEREDVDLIDVSTPGHMHAPIAIAAAQNGKAVWCEKPLANTLDEAMQMRDAVANAKVPHALFHNYRFAPATALAKKMIDNGDLGRIYHFRAVYLQDWIADPNFPLVWRLEKQFAGSGAHGDINAHIIDLARLLVGEIAEVSGHLETFVKQRPKLAAVDDRLGGVASKEMGDVTVDDAAMFLARFQNGALGTFEATRFAVGRKNHNRFEINGSKGSLVFNLERMNELEYYSAEDPEDLRGFRCIQATDASHPYCANWWPVGHIIGYEHTFVHLVADGLSKMAKGENPSPDFEDGLRNQRVLDAVERSSASRSWIGTC
ncbi:Gfo/Idh/MocA family oxidoreductase [Fimbriimonadia bacterium ATM]|nr:MAG: gfo/Idh/MocA family oxidoreductase [Armatimonadota bacterium]MBC6969564.1 gfo/Idh/MocA family oxidoreductase [Armatimonadota bacterium]MCE7898833.1 gfo/Idh/MocA family oxidoreductase [Armatimonadetes bacterium ATM1]MDL1928897.1 Gfo/Idh/MocA family oxidoreductase [Fimbriimonadia bacterium ATM]RIJ97820.1 MAG: dehydrogenase [Armatimonadota bacterium]